MFELSVKSFQHSACKISAKLHALTIYFRVTASTKVYSFEATSFKFFCWQNRHIFKSTISLNNQGMSRFKLVDVFLFNIESGHYGCTFRCSNNYFFVFIIVARAYAICISHYEAVAITYKSTEYIATIKANSSLFQYKLYI